MTKNDWKVIGAIAAIGGGLVALHGTTSKKWTDAHTFFTILGAIAALETL